MKTKILLLTFMVLTFASFVNADCYVPIDGAVINESTVLCTDTYNLGTDGTRAIFITSNDVDFDCNGSTIIGSGSGRGIETFRHDVTISNCNMVNYAYNFWVGDSSERVSILNGSSQNSTEYGIYQDASNVIDTVINGVSLVNDTIGIFNGKRTNVTNSTFECNANKCGDKAFGLRLENSNSSYVYNNSFNYGEFGIRIIYDTHNTTIVDNFIQNADRAISANSVNTEWTNIINNYFNNNGDNVRLISPQGELVNIFHYGPSEKDKSWSRITDGGQWSTTMRGSPTRDAANRCF